MKYQQYIKISTFAAAILGCFTLYAADPCPCENGTKPAVGKDACEKDVCDESLKKKDTEGCCNNAVYIKDNFCCVANKLLPKTPETPSAQKPDSSSNKFPVGNISIYSASDGTWSKVGNLWYEYKYYIPESQLTSAYAEYRQSWDQVSAPVYSKGCGNATDESDVTDSAPPGAGQVLDAIISITAAFGNEVAVGINSMASKVRGITPDQQPKKVHLKFGGKANKVFAVAAFKNKAYLASGNSDGQVKLEIHKYQVSLLDPNLIGLELRGQMATYYGSPGTVSFSEVYMGADLIQGPEGEGKDCCMSSNS